MADEDPDGLAAATEELYALDPADFVGARTELVRRLRAGKQRELAAAVAKLRRPSPAAWAVNRLVRDERDGVENLVRLGEEGHTAELLQANNRLRLELSSICLGSEGARIRASRLVSLARAASGRY